MPPRKRQKLVDKDKEDVKNVKPPKKKKIEKSENDKPVKDKKDVKNVKPPKIGKKKKIEKSENDKPVYKYWLMKSEPEPRFENGIDVKFGIEDLKKETDQTACWDGVRNYQARNFMKDMKEGQQAFFYHSNTKEPGIAGVIEIVKESYTDHTQFDKKDLHYDRSSTKDNPRWFMVDVKFQRMMKRYISLAELKSLHLNHKQNGGPLKNVALFTRARLSVQPLTEEEWNFILSLENQEKK